MPIVKNTQFPYPALVPTLLLLLLALFSCQKEDIQPDTRPEVCTPGSCDAPFVCLHGECVCPKGYTGDNCDEERKPAVVTITKVTILEFPETNSNGDPWDDGDGPDLALGIWRSGHNRQDALYLSSSALYENASSPGEYVFNNTSAQMTEVDRLYGIFLFDDDGPTSDGERESELIVNFLINPYEPGKGFPEERTLEVTDEIDPSIVYGKALVELSYSF